MSFPFGEMAIDSGPTMAESNLIGSALSRTAFGANNPFSSNGNSGLKKSISIENGIIRVKNHLGEV